MVSRSEIFLISTSVQGFIHGFAVLMFGMTMHMLIRDPRRRRVSYGMIAASSTLMTFTTAEFLTNVVRTLRAHITVGPKHHGGSDQFYRDAVEWTFIVKGCLFPVQIVILDAVVIYRAYVAWQSYYAIIVPGLGWCGLSVCTVALLYHFIHNAMLALVDPSHHIQHSVTTKWITARYASTIVTNASATALLACRIWQVNHITKASGTTSHLGTVFRVVVESGAIYTTVTLATLLTFASGSSASGFLRDLLPPIISIVFNMIVFRVGIANHAQLAFFCDVESTQRLTYPFIQGSESVVRTLATQLTSILVASQESEQRTDDEGKPDAQGNEVSAT